MRDRAAAALQPRRGGATGLWAGCLLLANDVAVLDLVALLVLVAGFGSPARRGGGQHNAGRIFDEINTRGKQNKIKSK
jgi:hypothetical protein